MFPIISVQDKFFYIVILQIITTVQGSHIYSHTVHGVKPKTGDTLISSTSQSHPWIRLRPCPPHHIGIRLGDKGNFQNVHVFILQYSPSTIGPKF